MKQWKLTKPYAATLEEFDEWDAENKAKYPVRFFLQETLVDIVTLCYKELIKKPINSVRWFIAYRIFKEHQYNIIFPRTLKPAYHDEDERILHSVMECLVRYIKTYNVNADYEINDVYLEMRKIYIWWTVEYPRRDEYTIAGEIIEEMPKFPKEWGFMPMLRKQYKDEPIMAEWLRISTLRRENNEQWKASENEMLIKVIQNRRKFSG